MQVKDKTYVYGAGGFHYEHYELLETRRSRRESSPVILVKIWVHRRED